MYNIIEITESNKEVLEKFISNNILPNSFRYFDKRKSDVIKHHVITIILLDFNLPIGYAHIDFDDNTYWFGICILDDYKNKGYGTQLMKYIFNHEKIKKINEIHLTVDKINNNAMHLYLKFHFIIIDEKDTLFIMKKINK
jgi:ribosomal protein S18 acetylase RimI-like enzyme